MDVKGITRRAFVRMSGILGLGAAVAPASAIAEVGFGNASLEKGRHKVAATRFLMGTFVSVTALDESKARAEEGIERAFGEIRRLSAVMDRHRAGTEISHLNETGHLRGAHPDLVAVAGHARRIHGQTGGAFDATVLPVVDYLKAHANPKGEAEISRAELAERLRLVNGGGVSVSGNDISFASAEMGLTLDGIGKGYIVDRVSEVLTACGVRTHMVNAGGDIRVAGDRTWTVAIEDPAGQGHYPAVVCLRNAAIATSGGYEQPFDKAGSLHHVINPASGLSPVQSTSVTVVAPSVMEADALATAAFVMDAKQGVRFVETMPSMECLILGASGARLTTGGWHRLERA